MKSKSPPRIQNTNNVFSLIRENKQLKEKLQEKTENLNNLTLKLNSYGEYIHIYTMEQKYRNFEIEIAQIQNEKVDLTKQIQDMGTVASSLRLEIQALKIERTALRKDLKESREEAQALGVSLKASEECVSRLEKELAGERAEAIKVRKEFEAKEREWERRLEAEGERRELELKQLREKEAKIQESLKEAIDQLNLTIQDKD